jgi:hypothetical protein
MPSVSDAAAGINVNRVLLALINGMAASARRDATKVLLLLRLVSSRIAASLDLNLE